MDNGYSAQSDCDIKKSQWDFMTPCSIGTKQIYIWLSMTCVYAPPDTIETADWKILGYKYRHKRKVVNKRATVSASPWELALYQTKTSFSEKWSIIAISFAPPHRCHLVVGKDKFLSHTLHLPYFASG